MSLNTNNLSTAFISTYPPQRCGIGTFTNDLVTNLQKISQLEVNTDNNFSVIAMRNTLEKFLYPQEVNFEIRQQRREDYLEAAEFLNISQADVISLQHEFGIFGGNDGDYILHVLNNLKKPVVTTLHTVLESPTPSQKKTLKAICTLSTNVVVLAQKAVHLLTDIFDVPAQKIHIIPHGTPDIPFLDSSYYKSNFHAEDKQVILTFGLLSQNKGIEYVIEALPNVVKEYPEILYIVLGATHPNVKKHEGEKYRISLEHRVKELGLEHHVIFYNQFVSLDKLIQFLVAADVYITPYLSKEQISSGTLAYALACGKAIISTPYWYAQELLADHRGILVPFKNLKKIEEKILYLLGDISKRNKIRKNAYKYGRKMIWPQVAQHYKQIFEKSIYDYNKTRQIKIISIKTSISIPEITLDHMMQLTDDTGIFQHAIYRTPSRFDGYTTDDNSRALMVAIMNYELFHDPAGLKLIHRYLSFLHYALHPQTHRFRNFMSFSRRWAKEAGSEDSHGRSIWSLGFTIKHAPNHAILSLSNHLFREALQSVNELEALRAISYTILGCIYYLNRFSGETETKNTLDEFAKKLSNTYKKYATKKWPWFENIVTYANARIPQALLAAGKYFNNNLMINQGLESLNWLLEIQTDSKNKKLSLIGNSGWYPKGKEKAQFDQQPLEIPGIIEACIQAYEITNDPYWKDYINIAFSWYLGKNDTNECLYDFSTGGCYDGLQRGGVNKNQGSESTISCLATLHIMYQLTHNIQTTNIKNGILSLKNQKIEETN